MQVLEPKVARKNFQLMMHKIHSFNYLLTFDSGKYLYRRCRINLCKRTHQKSVSNELNACCLFCHHSCISSDNKKTWKHDGENTAPLGFKRPNPWAIALTSAWSLSIFAVNVLMLRAQLSGWAASVASMAKPNAWISQKSAKTRAFIQESIGTVERFRPQWRGLASAQYNYM